MNDAATPAAPETTKNAEPSLTEQIAAAVGAAIEAVNIPALVDAALASADDRRAAEAAKVQKSAEAEIAAAKARRARAERAATKAAENAAKEAEKKRQSERARAANDYAALIEQSPPNSGMTLEDAATLTLMFADDGMFLPGFSVDLKQEDVLADGDGQWTNATDIEIPSDMPPMSANKVVILAEGEGYPVLVLLSRLFDLPIGGGRRGRIPARALLFAATNAAPRRATAG